MIIERPPHQLRPLYDYESAGSSGFVRIRTGSQGSLWVRAGSCGFVRSAASNVEQSQGRLADRCRDFVAYTVKKGAPVIEIPRANGNLTRPSFAAAAACAVRHRRRAGVGRSIFHSEAAERRVEGAAFFVGASWRGVEKRALQA